MKLKEFLGAVNVEFLMAKKNYDHTKKSAQEVSASAAASPSQSGDMFHSQGAADLAKQALENVISLKNEIETNLDSGISVVKSPCFINFGGIPVYLVSYPVLISGFKMVSSKSPLGISLLGKKVGDKVNDKEILEIG
jgi:hypothetical protein